MPSSVLARLAPLSIASLIAISSAAGGALAQTNAHQRFGENRAYFQDYLGACRLGGYCSALAYHGAGPDAAGVDADYVLRIAQPWRGSGYLLEFTAVESFLRADSVVTLIIDGEEAAVLQPEGEGWWNKDNILNEYVFGGDGIDIDFIERLKAGGRLRVLFTDEAGENRDIEFSLIGLTAALDWFDSARQD